MKRNVLRHTGVWVFLVWGGLMLMHRLPAPTVGEHRLRRVDLLADVRPPAVSAPAADTLPPPPPPPPPPKPAFADTCPAGLACIEDYGDSSARGMTPFYRALDGLAGGARRAVRIAYFGDSFIEGDILTATARGYGKRTELVEFTKKGRGTQGVIGIQCSERNGGLVGAVQVTEAHELMLISNQGTLVRTRVAEVSQLGRNTQGVTLIRLPADETLVSVMLITGC